VRELRAWDFCGYAELTLPLAKQGLVWIAGDNRDTRAADSNGSGKTTLFKALTWVIFGKTIDGDRNNDPGDKVIRHGAKRALVELDLDDGWMIRRERKRGSPRLALIQPDGAPWEGGGRAEVQSKIHELVGMDFDAFRNTRLYGQNDTARWASPHVTDAQRKDMLHKLLRSEVLGVCLGLARKRATEARKQSADLEAKAAQLRARLADIDLDRLRRRARAWDDERAERAEALLAEARRLKAEASEAGERATEVTTLRQQLTEANAELSALQAAAEAPEGAADARALRRQLDAAENHLRDAKAVVRDIERDLEALTGDRCGVCDAPLGEGAPARKIARLREMKAEASAAVKAAEGKRAVADKLVRKAEDEAAARAEAQRRASGKAVAVAVLERSLRTAENAAERARGVVARAKDKLDAYKAVLAETNPHEAGVAEAEARSTDIQAQLDAMSGDREAAATDAAMADFWVRGFGPQGLPSFILDSVMPYLTERANHYLETLADGDILMEFTTQRELKSDKGALRDEIAINWTIEGIAGYPPSGGQQRKMEVATDLALMDLAEAREGSGASLFMADEILDGLDAEGTERVMALLQEMRSRRSTVFVISHASSMHELFERQFTVVKEDGVSRLEIAR
jgi:DNA repair exonuclease SbcCD ATPase subunit